MTLEKIGIVGTGRLGLCLALNLEAAGFSVICYDIDKERVDSINEKTLKSTEPGVEYALLETQNLKATHEPNVLFEECNTLFCVIQTPSTDEGKYDHSFIDDFVNTAIYELGTRQDRHFIINSTVFPGYCDELQERIGPLGWTVSYNPEFIAQGSILIDQLKPDMVLIGASDSISGMKIQNIYELMCQNKPKYHHMSLIEAEITKLSLNCFLTTKISFANMIGDICQKVGARPHKVLGAIGSDSRIGNKYLKHGHGYGGPCFPRDNRALSIFAYENDINAMISKATDNYNAVHLTYQVEHFVREKVGVVGDSEILPGRFSVSLSDGVAYKQGTDLLTESQQLKFALRLYYRNFDVEIVDRKEILEQLKQLHPGKFKLTERVNV